jgi:NADH-quinone oxidoreductase subunit N
MNDLNLNYSLLIPEIILALLALAVVTIDLMAPRLRRENVLPIITGAGLVGVFAISLLWLDTEEEFAGLVRVDNYTIFFRCFFTGTALFVTILSAQFVKDRLRNPGEYYALILVSTIGAIYMAGARELLTAYLSLELLSFSLYILVSWAKTDTRSNEGGMKYMLLGAFASGILLYGISFIYGAAGTTFYAGIGEAFADGTAGFTFGTLLGLTLIIAGLGFKVAAVPFHMWTPDAYEGAPLPITAYLSATSKAAGFALLLPLFSTAFLPIIDDWQFMLAALAAITMMVGNVIALQQHNIKRLLAYSSIGQVGYMLMGITALSATVTSALLLHMTGYVITNIAAFTAIIAYHNLTGAENIRDFRGMSDRAPMLAAIMTIALFSLAGMPLFAGFLTKFIFFQSVAEADFFWLAALAVVASVISLYYYLYVIREMYVSSAPDPTRLNIPVLLQGTALVLALGIFFVGIYPAPLFNITDSVSQLLFP